MREYFANIVEAIWSVLVGMKTSFVHLFVPAVTLQYPDEKWPMPARARNKLFNKIEDCIGCYQCARACPVDCIFIETEKRGKDELVPHTSEQSGKHPMRLRVTRFDIENTLCCYCGLCTEVCPTECLVMTSEYEYSVHNRDDLISRFAVEKPRAVQGAGAPAAPAST